MRFSSPNSRAIRRTKPDAKKKSPIPSGWKRKHRRAGKLFGNGVILLKRGLTLTLQPDLGHTLHPGQQVIDSLAPETYQFGADDLGNKIGGNGEHIGGRNPVESLAEDGAHRTRERLNLRTKGHAEVSPTLLVQAEEHSHRVGALLVLAHILKVKVLTLLGLLQSRLISVGDERLALLGIGESGKELDDR